VGDCRERRGGEWGIAEHCLVGGINDGMQLVWWIRMEDNHTRSPIGNTVFIDQMEL